MTFSNVLVQIIEEKWKEKDQVNEKSLQIWNCYGIHRNKSTSSKTPNAFIKGQNHCLEETGNIQVSSYMDLNCRIYMAS